MSVSCWLVPGLGLRVRKTPGFGRNTPAAPRNNQQQQGEADAWPQQNKALSKRRRRISSIRQHAETFTLGVEEEYQIINAETRELRSDAKAVLPRAQRELGEQAEDVQNELYLSQIEIATPVCETLADVRHDLQRMRGALIAAAAKRGDRIAAAGTHPFSHWENQQVTPKQRYQELSDDFQQIVRELIIFGCHVHVGLEDREIAVQVMNRVRVWLAPLLALSSSSPFWLGEDTGYASFRTELWSRLPMSGRRSYSRTGPSMTHWCARWWRPAPSRT
jgi:YbdK family carboxylate-amine ligase